MITSLSVGRGGLGRFANQCFTIAGVISIAVKSGQPYAFPEWITKDNELFGQKADNINDHLLKPLPALASTNGFQQYPYFWGYQNVFLPTGNWSIDAHMQSEKFFKHCLPLIRETFTFKDEDSWAGFTALHYRAGDYIDDPTSQHPRCSPSYYQQAIRQFPKWTNFKVFSDEPDAFRHFIGRQFNGEGYVFHFHAERHYVEDFKIMKNCHSFICANSSFSLFAAILGTHPEKKIICPRNWFGSQMPPEFNTDDIYPEGAIIL